MLGSWLLPSSIASSSLSASLLSLEAIETLPGRVLAVGSACTGLPSSGTRGSKKFIGRQVGQARVHRGITVLVFSFTV